MGEGGGVVVCSCSSSACRLESGELFYARKVDTRAWRWLGFVIICSSHATSSAQPKCTAPAPPATGEGFRGSQRVLSTDTRAH